MSTVNVTAATPGAFAVTATTTHELIWSVQQSTTVDVWGLAFRIAGASAISGEAYESSDVLVAVQWKTSYGGSTDAAMQAIYQAATGGDFNSDGAVDGADFLLWQRSFGSTEELMADSSGNGIVDHPDLQSWKQNFAAFVEATPVLGVPEPGTMSLASISLTLYAVTRRRARVTTRQG